MPLRYTSKNNSSRICTANDLSYMSDLTDGWRLRDITLFLLLLIPVVIASFWEDSRGSRGT
jgi:hypothetical protein